MHIINVFRHIILKVNSTSCLLKELIRFMNRFSRFSRLLADSRIIWPRTILFSLLDTRHFHSCFFPSYLSVSVKLTYHQHRTKSCLNMRLMVWDTSKNPAPPNRLGNTPPVWRKWNMPGCISVACTVYILKNSTVSLDLLVSLLACWKRNKVNREDGVETDGN